MPTIEVAHMLDLDPKIPEKYVEVARRQGEDPEKVLSYISDLRNMIFEKGLCKPHRTDDEFLLRYLRARFFNVENAYKLMTRYYAFRDNNLELHKDVNPMLLTNIGDANIISVAPYRDQYGRRLMFYRIGNWKPSKISVDDLFRATMIILEIGAMEPISTLNGGVVFFDFEGFTLNHCWHMSPTVAQKIICLMVTCMALRTVAIHIVNQNWAFDAAFQVFKPFLNARMKEKIYIHGTDLSSIHKHVPPAHLPTKYGGLNPEYNYNCWLDNLKKDERVVKEMRELGYTVI